MLSNPKASICLMPHILECSFEISLAPELIPRSKENSLIILLQKEWNVETVIPLP